MCSLELKRQDFTLMHQSEALMDGTITDSQEKAKEPNRDILNLWSVEWTLMKTATNVHRNEPSSE